MGTNTLKRIFGTARIAALLTSAVLTFSGIGTVFALDNEPAVKTRLEKEKEKPMAGKLLVIGDSMTGWMGDRMNAYGEKNGYEVATVVWDGSTIRKWGASSARLKGIIKAEKPDAIIICLGMNELYEKNPEGRLSEPLSHLMKAIGSTPYVWIGPPTWPGKPAETKMLSWLKEKVGETRFYDSSKLSLPRQSKTNPHPSREGICKWVDSIEKWLPANTSFELPGYEEPASKAMKRSKTFIYKKMKESL